MRQARGFGTAVVFITLSSCASPLPKDWEPNPGDPAGPDDPASDDEPVQSQCLATEFLGPGNHLSKTVIVQSDGSILVAGESMRADSSDFFLLRLNGAAPDEDLGTDGFQVFNVMGYERGGAVALQPDGKIILAGTIDAYNREDFAVIRLLESGEIDLAFGDEGVASTSVLGWDLVTSVALQPDGKIVVAGFVSETTTPAWDFALVRFDATGALDTGFGEGGLAVTSVGPAKDYSNDVRILPDGKILLGGASERQEDGVFDFSVARYLNDGTLDASFGDEGTRIVQWQGASHWAAAMDLQRDGKIVVSGHQMGVDDQVFAVARLTRGGDLDSTFGSDGFAHTPVGDRGNRVFEAALQPDDKILVVGLSESQGEDNSSLAVARFDADGALDPSFGDGGAWTMAAGDGGSEIRDVVVDPEGRIILIGYSGDGEEGDIVFARLSPDGSLDTGCEP